MEQVERNDRFGVDPAMTLVIAFVGSRGAVMAGDMREIIFAGEGDSVEILEAELYQGRITTERALGERAEELGVEISIRDTKNKVSHSGDVLIGEVTSTEGGVRSRRRLYATTGAYAIVDFADGAATVRQQGAGSSFIVLGSEIAKAIAHRAIERHWKGGGIREAIETIMRIMNEVAEKTATVSRQYVMVQTAAMGDIAGVMRRDGVAAENSTPRVPSDQREAGYTGASRSASNPLKPFRV